MFEKVIARKNLAKLLDVVKIYYERLSKSFDKNFDFVEKKANPDCFSIRIDKGESLPLFAEVRFKLREPYLYNLTVTTEKLKEFLKLKTEFEEEYKIAENYAKKLTHSKYNYSREAEYDNSLIYSLNNIGKNYYLLISSIKAYKIYEKNN